MNNLYKTFLLMSAFSITALNAYASNTKEPIRPSGEVFVVNASSDKQEALKEDDEQNLENSSIIETNKINIEAKLNLTDRQKKNIASNYLNYNKSIRKSENIYKKEMQYLAKKHEANLNNINDKMNRETRKSMTVEQYKSYEDYNQKLKESSIQANKKIKIIQERIQKEKSDKINLQIKDALVI